MCRSGSRETSYRQGPSFQTLMSFRAGARHKLTQMERQLADPGGPVSLGLPRARA